MATPAAVEGHSSRSRSWFDPEIVRVVQTLEKDGDLWRRVASPEARKSVLGMEPGATIPASEERIDSLCHAFAQVVDAKSPYTFNHSVAVADAAIAISEEMGLAPKTITMVRRAALLHDIGKLSVSNMILEKPGKLNAVEWEAVKKHPIYTRLILEAVSGFDHLAFVAAAHHERLDGSGYPEGLAAGRMPLTARVIAVADVYQALSEKRPYRDSLPTEVVFQMMSEDVPKKLDYYCVEALKRSKRLNQGDGVAEAAMVAAAK